MSIDMYLSASKSQASSASSLCKKQVAGYNAVQKAISDFVGNAPDLKGKAYDSGKAYFNAVLLPLAKGGILLSEAVEKAVKKFPEDYVAKVDSGDLKQSELEERIRDVSQLLSQAQSTRNRINSSKTPDMSKGYQLNANSMLINAYSAQKQKLQEKLNKLLEFNAMSPQIFSEIAGLQSSVEQGLAQTKDSWNASTGTFTIPPAKDLEWTKKTNELYLARNFQLALEKIPDLSDIDLLAIAEYGKNNPNEQIPESLVEYLLKNKDDIISNVKNDALSNFIEQLGLGITRFSGLINIFEGIQGPNASNSFIIVNPNGIGSQILKYGKNVSSFGKFLGYGFMVAGFGMGMYDDINNQGKTVGQAFSHNTVSTGVGFVSGVGGAAAVGLLVSNPGGWAVLGGMAVGTIASVGFDYLYDNNVLHIQDGLDWAGDKIDDGLDWTKNKVDEGLSWADDKMKDAGQAISNFGDAINPMNWAW